MPNSCPICGKDINTCPCGRPVKRKRPERTASKIQVDFSHLAPTRKFRAPSPPGFWRTRDGTFKAITEMDDSYIMNCIRMLAGRVDKESDLKRGELEFELNRRKGLEGRIENENEVATVQEAWRRFEEARRLEQERIRREQEARAAEHRAALEELRRSQAADRSARQADILRRQAAELERRLNQESNSDFRRIHMGQLFGRRLPRSLWGNEPARATPEEEDPPKSKEPETNHMSVDPNKPARVIRRRKNG